MIILINQIIIGLFFLACLYCEVSKKYRDCKVHVAVRMALMLSSVILAVKLSVLATAPVIVKISVLILTLFCAIWLYKHVLRRQIRIKGYRIKKLYMEAMRGGKRKK